MHRIVDALVPVAPHGPSALAALIADGHIGEKACYKALAAHLGLAFRDDWPRLHPDAHMLEGFATDAVRLASDATPTGRALWLIAPQGEALDKFRRAPRDGRDRFALTTPSHLAALLHYRGQARIERLASDGLPDDAPLLSAKGIAGPRLHALFGIIGLVSLVACAAVPNLCAVAMTTLILAGLLFKIYVTLVALTPEQRPAPPALRDAELPVYSVLVPLRDEGAMLPQLLEALDGLDYPKAKLDVLLILEPEDRATREALAALRLPPWIRVIFGPVGGTLRTKPRALNIGLLAARGALLTVFDAEDRPRRDQLRMAAAQFAVAPAALACLQAALAIDNGDEGWLPRCFALEYATLFDLLNPGLARLGLPLALGGTSNHFRTASLKAAGGWDAWNVTEDADLGLRLARLGYRVDCLASTTFEAAPKPLAVWMKQRRRWTKGWVQTLLVLLRDAPAVCRALGAIRTGALALSLTNLLLGPLLLPIFCGDVLVRVLFDRSVGREDLIDQLMAGLFAGVFVVGALSALWCGVMALRRRPSAGRWPTLPLMPAYQMLVGIAAWMGVFDLLRAPHHWHKTAHVPDAKRLNPSWRAGQRRPRTASRPPLPA